MVSVTEVTESILEFCMDFDMRIIPSTYMYNFASLGPQRISWATSIVAILNRIGLTTSPGSFPLVCMKSLDTVMTSVWA
jgi:hypothetical protein